jgi:hypothetical protein
MRACVDEFMKIEAFLSDAPLPDSPRRESRAESKLPAVGRLACLAPARLANHIPRRAVPRSDCSRAEEAIRR